jgi:ribonuclease HI
MVPARATPARPGAGFALRAQDGTVLFTGGEYHASATNNFAEYRALICGLAKAVEFKIEHLNVRGDSQLVIRQMLGEYKVKHPNIIPLYNDAKKLAAKFKSISFAHIYREENKLADELSNVAITSKGNADALAEVGVR